MNKSQILLFFCLSFIIGILLNSFFRISQPIWLGFLILSILLIFFSYFLNKKILIISFCLLILLIAVFWHQRALNKQIKNYQQDISFQGIVVKEPEQRIDTIRLVVESKDIPGRVLVTAELYPQYNYGDRLEISGELKEPVVFDDFDYKEYLTKDKIYSVIYYPQMKLISRNQGKIFYQLIFNFKDKLRKTVDKILLPPKSSILKAVFLGDKYSLSDNLKENLNLTGTRHIVAISGMHMIIMVEILMFLFLALGFWRNQTFYLVISLLFLYIIMIGAPSSAIRAGIMAGLLLFAQKIGRLNSSDRAVIFAAVLMLIFNPLLLKIDVGFQLSFIATLSIIYLKPILDNIFKKIPNPFNLRDILTLTLSAQIGVLPLLIFHFGQISLISPLANILIVPFLPFLMIGGIIVSFMGLIYLPPVKLLAYPLYLLLTYFLKTINLLANFPLAGFQLKNVSWIILIGYYLILILLVLKRKPPVLLTDDC